MGGTQKRWIILRRTWFRLAAFEPEGFIVKATGETIPYKDTGIRHLPDGEYHWCSVNGSKSGRTVCLFVPPSGF